MDNAFGNWVRGKRTDRGVGLRRFARQVGISPTYLSKIERGEFPPPAEGKIVAIADALGENRDELLSLAGKVRTDLSRVILRHPQAYATLLRCAAHLSEKEVLLMAKQAATMRKPKATRTMEADAKGVDLPY
ncbi:MAG: helix-turn-helix domain-containing protein [Leptospirillia bacterium]